MESLGQAARLHARSFEDSLTPFRYDVQRFLVAWVVVSGCLGCAGLTSSTVTSHDWHASGRLFMRIRVSSNHPDRMRLSSPQR